MERETPEEPSEHSRDVESMERFLGLVNGTATVPLLTQAPVPSIPGYEVIEVLGHGGMGVVYKARHVRLNRLVAIKMIVNGAYARPEDHIRFMSEAEAVARLQHPNIIQIYEINEHSGLPYLALEFVEGGTLHERLRTGPLVSKEAAELIETLARTVQAAHERGVVHRDLKPANILLTREGSPKITDFGLAKHAASPPSILRSEEIIGTPSYMAPEQVDRRFGSVGPAADVYALGAIFYELLTGRPPFRGTSLIDTLQALLNDEPESTRRLNPKVARDLDTICLKTLSKEPARRYATALDLAEDVRRYLRNEPILARRVGPPERVWRWCRRNPVVAATMCLLMIAFAVVVLALERAQRHAFNEQRQRFRAEHQLAENELGVGLSLCDQGHESLGLLWMAHALKHLPAGSGDLEHTIRANLSAWQMHLHPLQAILQHSSPDGGYPLRTPDRRGGAGGVAAVALTPDGRYALTGGWDSCVRLWETSTGKQRWWDEQRGRVGAIAISPDGRLALTGSIGKAYLRKIENGEPVGDPFAFVGPVFAVAFSPNGKRAVIGGLQPPGRGATKEHEHSGTRAVIDGLLTLRRGAIRLWGLATLRPPESALEHEHNGKRAVIGGRLPPRRGATRLWDLATLEPIGPTLKHKHLVRTVTFSHDGRTFLIGDEGGAVWTGDAATGQSMGQLLWHGAPVNSVAFRPDGKLIATGTDNKAANIWNAVTGKPAGDVLPHGNQVVAVAFTPNGRTVVTGSSDKTCRIWDLATRTTLGAALEHREEVRALAVGTDGRTILTGSSDGAARLWRIEPNQGPKRCWEHEDALVAVCISPDGKTALTGLKEGEALLWNIAKGERVGTTLTHPRRRVHILGFSPDSRIALTCADTMVRLWATTTGQCVLDVVHESAVYAAAFSADGKVLVVVDADGKVSKRNVADGTLIGQPFETGTATTAAAVSPDGESVLVAGDDGQTQVCQVWEIARGCRIGPSIRHSSPVIAAAFSPDGKRILTGCQDGVARMWEVLTGKSIGKALEHQRGLTVVAFSADDRVVMTRCHDRTVSLWAISTGKRIGKPLFHGKVNAGALSPDGSLVLTGSEDGIARWYDVLPPLEGDPDTIALRLSVLTGLELDDFGVVRSLSAEEWERRRSNIPDGGFDERTIASRHPARRQAQNGGPLP